MPNNVKMLTLQDIADKLNVSKRTVWRYYNKGDLEGIKLDGVIRIPEENLEKFLKERSS